MFRTFSYDNRCIYLCICSPRSVGLVDYDDDEDDEDYKPPPRKQPETDEDEGTMESLRLKRKLAPKDKEPELTKKQQRLGKNSKSKDSVFAALCSTLSHAVLPTKKTASTVHTTSPTGDGEKSLEENDQEREVDVAAVSRRCVESNSSSDEENHRENESAASRGCTERLHGTSDNRQLGGEECSLLPPPKSSPEMTVNGS